jgi:hypothetical protein
MAILAVVVAAPGLILAAQLGAFQTDETRPIPLNTVYATFNQEGLKSVDTAAHREGLGEISSMLQEGSQQLVLCLGSDLAAAVKGSASSFSIPEESFATISGATTDTLWLVAYLGSDGSLPPAYQVRYIETTGKTIRVAYERDGSPVRSCDLRAYVVWVPLGRVEEGAYALELFDVAAQKVTLAKLWQVTVK